VGLLGSGSYGRLAWAGEKGCLYRLDLKNVVYMDWTTGNKDFKYVDSCI